MIRALIVSAALLQAPAAFALADPMAGMYAEVAGSAELHGTPIAGDVGGQVGLGWWSGRYDDNFAFGRFWSVGGAYRLGALGGLRHTALLEVRRGADLLVATPYVALVGGAGLAPGGVAPIAQLGVGGRFRTSRFYSLSLRLDAGASFSAAGVAPLLGTRLGVTFARPFRKLG